MIIECFPHIDQAGEVSLTQVVQDGGFVEEGEGGHVLHLAEFGRVHLLDVVFVHRHLLTVGELHQHLQGSGRYSAQKFKHHIA